MGHYVVGISEHAVDRINLVDLEVGAIDEEEVPGDRIELGVLGVAAPVRARAEVAQFVAAS